MSIITITVRHTAVTGPLRAPYKAWRARYFSWLRMYLAQALGWRT